MSSQKKNLLGWKVLFLAVLLLHFMYFVTKCTLHTFYMPYIIHLMHTPYFIHIAYLATLLAMLHTRRCNDQ